MFFVRAFPQGDDTWRIDWFGDVSYPNRSERSDQPSVNVLLSRVVATGWMDDEAELLQPQAVTHFSRQLSCGVSVGTIVLLRIGNLWRCGSLVARPRYEEEEFNDILIDRSTTSIVKAGTSLDDGSFLLPMQEHPGHMSSTQSSCVTVGLSDGRLLVVPVMELVRFYFGSSSALLSRLFQPDFRAELLYSQARKSAFGRAHFRLASGIPRASVHDVARIAFDKKAAFAAAQIGQSCIQGAQTNEPIHPQCGFPFEGRTSLRVKGKWLSHKGKPRRTFIAFELTSCSHAFPYKALSYEVSAGDAETDRSSPRLNQTSQASATRSAAAYPPPNVLTERDAGRKLSLKLLRVPMLLRFPDLKGKPAYASEAMTASGSLAPLGSSKAVTEAALGEGTTAGRIRPVELVEAQRSPIRAPIPDFASLLIDALRSFSGVGIVLTAGDDDGWTVPATAVMDGGDQDDPALFIDGRPRRLCSVHLCLGQRHALVAAIEDRPMTLLLLSWTPQLDGTALGSTVIGAYKALVAPLGSPHAAAAAGAPVLSVERITAHLRAWFAQSDEPAAILLP